MDLRDRLELVRHVLGCALLDGEGHLLGQIGPKGDAAADAARRLWGCVQSLGLEGEACFAANVDVHGGQLVARTEGGRLLVVRTDGTISITSDWVTFLVNSLTPAITFDDDERHETGVRFKVVGEGRLARRAG